MATILLETDIDAPADAVWDALADFGALHTRVAPGFVTNTVLEPGARVVTFGRAAATNAQTSARKSEKS